MPTTRQVRQRMLQRYGLGKIIENTGLSFGTTYVQSTRHFTDDYLPTGYYRGKRAIIWRPDAATAAQADHFRRAGDYSASTNRLTIVGANYTDTTATSEEVELWYNDLQPDKEILEAIQNAQAYLGARILLPLTIVANGGFFLGTTNFTGSSATLDVADAVMQGRTALEVTNSGANGAGYSDAFGVTPGATLHAWAIGLGDTGTNRVVYEDVTNSNATVGEAQTFTAKRANVAYQQLTVPDDCYQMRVGLGGVASNAVTRWDQVYINHEKDGRLFLPSAIQEAWEFEALCYQAFDHQIDDGIYDALSVRIQEVPQADYTVSDLPGDSHTPIVQLHNRSWLKYPLVIQARLRDSTIDTLTADTDVTGQPLAMLAARATMMLIEAWGEKIPNGGSIHELALAELNALAARRVANGPAKRKAGFSYPFTR